MNSTKVTPDIRQKLFLYDEAKFTKTIAKFNQNHIRDIKISVYAPPINGGGEYINILHSDLSEEKLDNLISRATYTLYEGPAYALRAIGVL